MLAEKKGAQSHVYQIHEYIGNQTQDSKKDHIIAWFQSLVTVGNVPIALKTIFIFQGFVLTQNFDLLKWKEIIFFDNCSFSCAKILK